MFTEGPVNLYTNDIEAALHFYRGLGFRETFRAPKEGAPEHVELSLGGLRDRAGRRRSRRVHQVDPASGSAAMVLVIWTDDVGTAFDTLTRAGTAVVQPPHDTGDDNRNALLRDPDGNLVEIVSKVRAAPRAR